MNGHEAVDTRRVAQKIELILYDNGEVDIKAPLTNKILCLGLLDIAKRLVHEFKPAAATGIPGFATVPGSFAGKLKGN